MSAAELESTSLLSGRAWIVSHNKFISCVYVSVNVSKCQRVKVSLASGVVSTCWFTRESKSEQLTRFRDESCLLISPHTMSLLLEGEAGLPLEHDWTAVITCCNLSARATPRATHAANISPSNCASKTESRTLRQNASDGGTVQLLYYLSTISSVWSLRIYSEVKRDVWMRASSTSVQSRKCSGKELHCGNKLSDSFFDQYCNILGNWKSGVSMHANASKCHLRTRANKKHRARYHCKDWDTHWDSSLNAAAINSLQNTKEFMCRICLKLSNRAIDCSSHKYRLPRT